VKPGAREGAAEGAHEAAETQQRGGGATPGAAGGLPAAPQGDVQSGHTYGAFSERDERIWAAETDKFLKQGHAIFHDANAVGSANAVSCDMCHPDASNTHPETYPKFQVQLGRVALLRDMINWCIQNPSRGRPLPDDDPKLKAIEAYILAQRKGTPLEYGKH
jgi:cytochrome c